MIPNIVDTYKNEELGFFIKSLRGARDTLGVGREPPSSRVSGGSRWAWSIR